LSSDPHVLLVEPDDLLRQRLAAVACAYADVADFADFMQARRCLLRMRTGWIVTNLRLGAYNGLHLVHLAAAAQLPVRYLVYSGPDDIWLAREAQRAGAFYEARETIHRALGAYLGGALPDADRRSPERPHRRRVFRGGRRCTDAEPAALESAG
jgi:ActR/RegA family two-component response regulator